MTTPTHYLDGAYLLTLPSCGPCRMIKPKIQTAASETETIVHEIDMSTNSNILFKDIKSVPTLVIIQNGKIVDSLTGLQSHKQVQSFLENHASLISISSEEEIS